MFSTYSFGGTVIADLAGDYASAKSGFTVGGNAVLTGTHGTWTFQNTGSVNAQLVYATGSGVSDYPNFDGFHGPHNTWGFRVPILSDGKIFNTDDEAQAPITDQVAKLNFHPSNSTDKLNLNWASNYSGPVRVTGFVQHAMESHSDTTGIDWSLSMSNTSGNVSLGSGHVKSNGMEFTSPTMLISTGSALNFDANAANGLFSRGTSYVGIQVEAVPYITSLRDSYVSGSGADPDTIALGWSYYVAKDTSLNDKIDMYYSATGAPGGIQNRVFTGGNGSGITPNKIYGNSQATDSTELEFHPANHETGYNYVVARWDVGEDDGNWFDIMGSVRQLNDQFYGVDFSILADGEEVFRIEPELVPGSTDKYYIPYEEYFLEQIYASESIDFVVNSLGHYNGDSTLLSAYIMAGVSPIPSDAVPEPATWAMLIFGVVGVLFLKKKGN